MTSQAVFNAILLAALLWALIMPFVKPEEWQRLCEKDFRRK